MADQSISNADPRSFPNSIGPVAAIDTSPGIVCRISAANEFTPAKADTEPHSVVVGVNRHFVKAGDNGNLCYAGPVELTTDEWDAIAASEGGLTVGAPYYLSAATAGHITLTAPGVGVVVGVALSPTTLLVGINNVVAS